MLAGAQLLFAYLDSIQQLPNGVMRPEVGAGMRIAYECAVSAFLGFQKRCILVSSKDAILQVTMPYLLYNLLNSLHNTRGMSLSRSWTFTGQTELQKLLLTAASSTGGNGGSCLPARYIESNKTIRLQLLLAHVPDVFASCKKRPYRELLHCKVIRSPRQHRVRALQYWNKGKTVTAGGMPSLGQVQAI